MEIGYRYDSPAVVLEAGRDGRLHEHPRESAGRPGHARRTLSSSATAGGCPRWTCSASFVLLAGADGDGWMTAISATAEQLGAPLELHRVGGEGFEEAYG